MRAGGPFRQRLPPEYQCGRTPHDDGAGACAYNIELDAVRVQALDAIRRKRNVIDYSGDEAEPSEVKDAITAGAALLTDVKAWLARNHR